MADASPLSLVERWPQGVPWGCRCPPARGITGKIYSQKTQSLGRRMYDWVAVGKKVCRVRGFDEIPVDFTRLYVKRKSVWKDASGILLTLSWSKRRISSFDPLSKAVMN